MRKSAWNHVRYMAASDRISGLVMMACALLGLLLANAPWTQGWFGAIAHTHIGLAGTNLNLPIGHWAQDGLLTVFFLVVGLDLKQELTTGALANARTAVVPMLCAVGGMLMPPLLFIATLLAFAWGGAALMGHAGTFETMLPLANGSLVPWEALSHGWAIPTATDIAFSLAIVSFFAKNLPGAIRVFLMTLATVDDLLAIVIIALFFSSLHDWYWFFGIAVCSFLWYFLVRMKRVPWLLVGAIGIAVWIVMFEAGIHPTLAGVLVGLLTPARPVQGELTPRAERYREKLQPLSALVALPIFALFATGVHFETISFAMLASPLVVGITVALVCGKPIGIMLTAWIATRWAAFRLPRGVKLADLVPTACACGIGFTVSLLIASLAFGNPELSAEARFGVLAASLLAAAISGALLHRQSRARMARQAASSSSSSSLSDAI